MIQLFAQTVPGPVVDPNAVAGGLVEAINSSNWGLVVGCAIMLVVWIIRILWPKLSTKLLPYLAVVVGALGGVGVALMSNPGAIMAAILAGVQAGLSAAGTWGLFGVLRKKPT